MFLTRTCARPNRAAIRSGLIRPTLPLKSGGQSFTRQPMPDQLHVRPAARSDYEQWLPLWDGYNAFYGRSGPTALSPEITRMTWRRFFDAYEPVYALVAESDGRLSVWRTICSTARPPPSNPSAICKTCSPTQPPADKGSVERSSAKSMRRPDRPERRASTGKRIRPITLRSSFTIASRSAPASLSTARCFETFAGRWHSSPRRRGPCHRFFRLWINAAVMAALQCRTSV